MTSILDFFGEAPYVRMPVDLKSETTSRVGGAMWWRWLAASVAPNPRVWLVASRLWHLLARATLRALFAVGFGLCGLSWGVYLRTSRFLDWEALRFTVRNFRLLWMYARQAGHGGLLGTAAALVGVGTAIVGGGSWVHEKTAFSQDAAGGR